MPESEKILTLHPQGKKGTNISKAKYDVVKKFIIATLKKEGEISYEALSDQAIEKLQPTFDGRVVWYVVTVKLDLEARKVIERIPRTSPHRFRLVGEN